MIRKYFSKDVQFESSSSRDNWTCGEAVLDGVHYEYEVKHFDEPSIYGIQKGRISKLHIMKQSAIAVYDDETIAYDRAWCKYYKNATRPMQAVYRAILKKYN